MTEINYMDIAEFRSLGYLQEINRLFLHPLGLALAVNVEEDGAASLAGIWDYREDPEGITFGSGMIEAEKIAAVKAERAKHEPHRIALFGHPVQGVDDDPGEFEPIP